MQHHLEIHDVHVRPGRVVRECGEDRALQPRIELFAGLPHLVQSPTVVGGPCGVEQETVLADEVVGDLVVHRLLLFGRTSWDRGDEHHGHGVALLSVGELPRLTVDSYLTVVKKGRPVEADGRTVRRQRTRERILRATRRLIERHGTTDVSMEQIAGAADVTRRTIYDHFGSRAGLLVALAEQADRDSDLDQLLAPVFNAPDAMTAIERLVDLVAEVTPRMLDLATAIERARVDDPDASAAWDDRMASRMGVFRSLADRLDQEGALRPELDVQEAADLIYTALAWQTWRLLVVDRGWTPQRWIAHTKSELRRALTPDR